MGSVAGSVVGSVTVSPEKVFTQVFEESVIYAEVCPNVKKQEHTRQNKRTAVKTLLNLCFLIIVQPLPSK